jgi:hypothetical protein
MAFNSADWSIDYDAKTVTNDDSGTGDNVPAVYGDDTYVGPVIDFFQWLATTFAVTAQMDDDYAIQSDTPTVYKWLNGWTFGHADDYKYLKGGSIEDPSGSGTSTADSLWANLYSIGTQTSGTQLYMIQNDAEVTPWWITGNIDILVLVKDTGSWIQSEDTTGTPTNGGLWMYAREYGDLYDHNFVDLSGGGRNPVGINTAVDPGLKEKEELYITVSGVSGTFTPLSFVTDTTTGAVGKIRRVVGSNIYVTGVRGGDFTGTNTLQEYSDRELQSAGDASATITSTTAIVTAYTPTVAFGTYSYDLNNGNGSQPYDAQIDCNAHTMAETYAWTKYVTRYGTAETINGDSGQEYRSCDEGTYPEIKTAPFGTLAGTTFYGGQGVWVLDYASADFVLIDANGVEQAPPNYQKVICSHADLKGDVSGDGSVTIYVAEISGSAIIKDQYTIDAVTTTTIQATASININKTPQSGVLRIGDTRYDYTAFSGDTFTGVSPDPTGETGDFYVPLLDLEAADVDATTKQSDNIIYGSAFDVRTVVRRYGTKPYSVDTQFTSAGLSFSPIITDDPQAT